MRLLLVEDTLELATALRQGLSNHGFEVDLVTDGEAALQKALASAYAAIVLDRMLPRLDGVSVCRALRQRKSNVPVLMLTARDAVEDRVEGLDAGADDYLVKPFAFPELLARLKALTRRKLAAGAALLQVDDVVLDPASGLVTKGARSVQLSAKEVLLVAALMRAEGRVLSHAQLIDAVWGEEESPSAEVLRAHVKNVRRKAGVLGGASFIETVHGLGYRLVG